MNAIILNTEFESVGMIDVYESFIWTDRFREYGDFEISMPIGTEIPDFIRKDYYVWIANSKCLMIIESIQIDTDIETGPCLIVKGRSLKSILKRRIVYSQTSTGNIQKRIFSRDRTTGVKPNLQNGIKTLLEENIISPAIAARKIPNFIFESSTDPAIVDLTFEAEYFGEDLYDIIVKLCTENDIGFEIVLNDLNQFVFRLVAGTDRSYSQETNPYIVFSNKYNNIFNTQYLESNTALKNTTLIAGPVEDDSSDTEKEYSVYWLATKDDTIPDNTIGINRREIFTDATSISTKDDEGEDLSYEQHRALLRQKGIDTLMENTAFAATEGEVDTTRMYVYDKDYFLGDLVQIEDEYGHEGQARITEMIFSYDTSGVSIYPTFTSIQKGVYE